jgi:hypothetical protein
MFGKHDKPLKHDKPFEALMALVFAACVLVALLLLTGCQAGPGHSVIFREATNPAE